MSFKGVGNTERKKSSLAEKVSRASFFLYVVFMLIGTAPLQERDASDITTSNPINQLVDSLIPFVSILCLWPKRKTLLLLLKEEKYLSLFLIWCLFTVLWSDFPLSSFKLWVRLLGSTTVVLAFLLNLKSPDDALKYLKVVFAIYIPVSFLAIAFVHTATQWEFPAWRGLADHKNTLGQISLIAAVVWAFAIWGYGRSGKRIGSWLFLFASVILLLGSKSTTSLIALLFLLLIGLCLFVQRNLGKMLSSAMIGCALLVLVLANTVDLSIITGAFGKDTTFTDRDAIWAAILDEIATHPLLGCGIGGFWVAENPKVLRLAENDELGWLPPGGHEGYLDLMNETGVVGLTLLTLMVLCYFKRLSKLRKPHFWKWFFFGLLIINLTESTIFRSGSFSGWFFVLSYLALHVELVGQEVVSQRVLGRRAEMNDWLLQGPAMAKGNEGSRV